MIMLIVLINPYCNNIIILKKNLVLINNNNNNNKNNNNNDNINNNIYKIIIFIKIIIYLKKHSSVQVFISGVYYKIKNVLCLILSLFYAPTLKL